MSELNYYVKNQDEIIGFIVCFRENSEYSSKNYKFFNQQFKKFIYIDRVAIKEKYRRKGIGKNIYSAVEDYAIARNIPICCEVNTDPMNEISIEFHMSLGFKKIGEYDFDDHSVAYFLKNN